MSSMTKLFSIGLLAALLLVPAQAQTTERPLVVPFDQPPGINTWLFGQPYGNTVGAYNNGTNWYSAGQGLHFGLDFSAPCGTPVVAVADGTVVAVDDFGFGSRPHNLLIRHDALSLVSLYGHLLQTPNLVNGQQVTQGQVVGLTGDPDETCDSRPHLHYELRSLNYLTTYNPIMYMDASWHSLSLIGNFSGDLFTQDLDNARRWMSIDDQPDVQFGGARLNAYVNYAPIASDMRPAPNPPVNRVLPVLTAAPTVELKRIGYDECCPDYQWHPAQPDTLYAVDGAPGQRAVVFTWSAASGTPIGSDGMSPMRLFSPDGTLETMVVNNQAQIRRLADGTTWQAPTAPGGRLPAISADSSRLLWWQQIDDGQERPQTQMFVSDITGQTVVQIQVDRGSTAQWLDGSRLLIATSQRPNTTLEVYDTATGERFTLGTWYRIRGVTIAPGGGRIMFYVTNQPNPDDSGIFMLEMTNGAVPVKMPWFGGWKWRDANSVYYIPFAPATPVQQLAYYDLPSGTNIMLTDPAAQPFTIMNARWEISADGKTIAFHNLVDRNLWLMTVGG